jgi:hypothetical protein
MMSPPRIGVHARKYSFAFEDERIVSHAAAITKFVASHSIPRGHSALSWQKMNYQFPVLSRVGGLARGFSRHCQPPVLGSRSTDLRANFAD